MDPSQNDISENQPNSPRPSVIKTKKEEENQQSPGFDHVPIKAVHNTISGDQIQTKSLDTSNQTLDRFYHQCTKQARIQLFISSGIILALSQFKFNFFLISIIIWCTSFQMSKNYDSHKEDLKFYIDREYSKIKLNDPSNPNQGQESVEWINTALKSLWPLISPDIFRPVIDLLEDTLKILAPGIVTTVRVEDLDQGRNPLRLVSFKTLDVEDPWVKNQVKLSDLPGEFINLEVEFAYRKNTDTSGPISNAHFVAYFGIGIQKLASCEMPVFVQIDGLHGKIKLRIQLIAVPPFVQTTTFSFSYLPQVEITAKPMMIHSFNVMSLPVISSFIRSSVDVLLGNFCLPFSYTLDLSRILLGNDALMRPRHVGVVAIAIHSASNLKISDILNQSSDPYVSISFIKSASKPLFSTRIHFKDLNPVFEEMAFILITPDQLLERERICLTICDSDRISADNVLGKVDVDLLSMSQNPGVIKTHHSELAASFPGYTAQGSLHWSSGYFGFHEDFTSNEPPTFGPENHVDTSVKKYTSLSLTTDERLLTSSPQRPNSGIISIQIHSLAQIAIRNPKHFRVHNPVKHHSRKIESDERNLPSTYCFVLINDERVFETRVKKQSSDPYIVCHSGIEYFIQDFDRTRVDLVVMEVRAREHDAIVGIVAIPLITVLADQQQLTKWWTLTGGNGSGKMRASVLFQPIDIQLERPLCGWSVGVIEVFKVSIIGLPPEYENCYIKIKVDSQSSQHCQVTDSASAITIGHSTQMTWVFKPRIKIAVMSRIQSLLSFQLMKRATGKLSIKDHAVSKPTQVWLSDVSHEELVHIDVELLKTDGLSHGKLASLKESHRNQSMRKRVELPKQFSQLPCHSSLGSTLTGAQPSIITAGQRNSDDDLGSSHRVNVPSISQQLEGHTREIYQDLQNSSLDESQTARFHASFRFVPGITKVHRDLESTHPGLMEVYQTCQRTISSGDRMRHPILVDTSDTLNFPTSPPTFETDHNSPESIVPDPEPHVIEKSETAGEDGKPTSLQMTDESIRDQRRLEILDLDESDENWTDDETIESEEEEEEEAEENKSINTNSGISLKLLKLKQKTHDIKEVINSKVSKIHHHQGLNESNSGLNGNGNATYSSSASNIRRRKELKGESKEVYNLGPSKLKPVRTVKWIRDSAKVGYQKFKHTGSHQTPKHGTQKEKISSF
ncbi:hypothetical protein CROQUDRAFT_657125 [Cronartium quercuum f. sp. fusiforme G11]|uniref:C2 domain-containing protein n=1 Tax=Cronartium quercuum f. sp. fusiforme G11 TaxID=708437 RepID=A0A9P6NM18_9BASI|nr:hypothetical protein CROQUDRAFT_657125 [Cronartium quercuum f. sp. fusiforme G11]